MRRRFPWVVVLLLALVTVGFPDPAHADMKLAILKVKGMVCSS